MGARQRWRPMPESKGENRMIKQIIKSLKENLEVTDWLISETTIESSQAFYVLQRLETTRVSNTCEYLVTVYHKFTDNLVEYLGSSSFAVSHKLRKNELAEKISEAVFASKFIKNKTYNLVKGGKRKSWKEKEYEDAPFVLLDKIANVFTSEANEHAKFNALELFCNKTITHVVNSQGVDLSKTLYQVNVEAIPSFDGPRQKVELYKYFTYKTIDFEAIKSDAVTALKEVTARYSAEKIKGVTNIDVVLKDLDVAEFFKTLIEDYSYVSVYKQNTDKKIFDDIQKDAEGDLLKIAYVPSSKADAFDKDGVILKPVDVIANGILASYYGGNQYAQYLKMEPTGIMDTIEVEKGATTLVRMCHKPHLEIIALSGIQIDMYSGYIGGEVRLALYYDGRDYMPVSGLSFSGNIDKCLKNIILSKEKTQVANYQGPKYVKLPGMDIL